MNNLRNHIEDLVRDFCESSENNLGDGSGERAWAEPVVGFAAGNDPIFGDYKTHVGTLHWTPKEIFDLAFGGDISADEISVISWILPQTERTRIDNRAMDAVPAERWARSRIFGEAFNSTLRKHVQGSLTDAGYRTVSPMLHGRFRTAASDAFQVTSTWSERHIAHACGLGTFGLCDGLITPVGKAVRFGSAVVEAVIEPTSRPYTDHQAYCLFHSRGLCGKCIDRCPAGALSTSGHDKSLCGAYLHDVTAPHVENEYGFEGYGCGLCQTGVPCESRIPTGV